VEGDGFPKGVERFHDETLVFLADFPRVIVEEGRDLKSAGPEPAVFQQGPAQVPDPDQSQRPLSVDADDPSERGDQLVNPIADSRVAELTEERQVLPHLRILDRQGLAELIARNGRQSLPMERFELSEIEAETADHRLRS
jgi:hypothetical protein